MIDFENKHQYLLTLRDAIWGVSTDMIGSLNKTFLASEVLSKEHFLRDLR